MSPQALKETVPGPATTVAPPRTERAARRSEATTADAAKGLGDLRSGRGGPSGVLALQRVAGNAAAVSVLADTVYADIANRVADDGGEKVIDAIVEAVSAYLVKHIEGTKRLGKTYGASKREEVVKARSEALRLADILAYAAVRELREGTGLYGSTTGDEKTDAATELRRTKAKGKGQEKATAELAAEILHTGTLEAARRVVRQELSHWFPTPYHEAWTALHDAALSAAKATKGSPEQQEQAARDAAGKLLPGLVKSAGATAVDSVSGSKNKWVRDKLKDQVAGETTKVLGAAIVEESGPKRQRSKVTSDAVEATFEAASVGKGLEMLAKLIDHVVSHNGDQTTVDVLVKIPVSHGFFVSLHVTGTASMLSDVTSVGATFTFGAGWEAPHVAQAMLEAGGYILTKSNRAAIGCMEMASYALYRRFVESSVIPRELTNSLYGAGGGTRQEGQSKSDAEYLEAEAWAAGIEKKMTEADVAETGGVVTASGKAGTASVAEVKGSVSAKVGTRYTKKGIEAARAAGKGKAVLGTRGAQSSLGETVTTVVAQGSASAAFGGSATAQASATFGKHATPLEGFVVAGVGFKLPAGTGGDLAKWVGDAVKSVGSALVNTINAARAKKKMRVAEKTGKLALSTAETSVKEPQVEAALKSYFEPKGKALLEKAKSGLSTLSGTGKGAVHQGGSAATKKGIVGALEKALSHTSSHGYQVLAHVNLLEPKKSAIMVQQTQTTAIDLTHVAEVTLTKAEAIVLFNFATKTLEIGGAAVNPKDAS